MTRDKSIATAAKDARGRTIYRGSQGGLFVLKNDGTKKYVTAADRRAAERALAQRLARSATRDALARHAAGTAAKAAAARRPSQGPKGMGLRKDIYVRNAGFRNGYAVDPVSQNRIRTARAVVIGKQTFDADWLRNLLQRNPRARNPVTQQPFPEAIYAKYGPRTTPNRNDTGTPRGGTPNGGTPRGGTPRGGTPSPANSNNETNGFRGVYDRITREHGMQFLSGDERRVWRASLHMIHMLRQRGLHHEAERADYVYDAIQDLYGVSIVLDYRDREEQAVVVRYGFGYPLVLVEFGDYDIAVTLQVDDGESETIELSPYDF